MATSASKRKQDEKHLKQLREMVALAHNKQCFDCHQRGPTYVNMTIGSFICTSCSGMLRGLNPPHRVKSISMTSFTPEEMDILRSRGNHYCKRVWLARFNPSVDREPDSKDEHKVKEYMANKYEKKRYFAEGTDAMGEEARSMNTPAAKPDTKPLRTLTGNSLPALRLQKPTGTDSATISKPPAATNQQPGSIQAPGQPAALSQSQPAAAPPAAAPTQAAPPPAANQPRGFDLLSDLGGDPFAGAPKPAANSTGGGVGGGFADFSQFSSGPPAAAVTSPPQTTPTFPTGGGRYPAVTPPSQTTPTFPSGGALLQPMNNATSSAPNAFPASSGAPGPAPSAADAQSAADKYAALANLDNVFGGGGQNNASVNWDGSVLGGPGTMMGGAGQAVFGSSPGTNSTAGFGTQTNSTEMYWGMAANSAQRGDSNPFHTNSGSHASNPFGTSQPSFSGPAQPVANPATTPGGNPFVVGPGAPQVSGAFSAHQQGFGGFPNAPTANVNTTAQNGAFNTNLATRGVPQGQPQFPPAQGFGAQPPFGSQPGAAFGIAPPSYAQVSAAQQYTAKLAASGGVTGAPGGQYPGPPAQAGQYPGWGVQQPQPAAAGNPFMAPSVPQQVAPRAANSNNPFL